MKASPPRRFYERPLSPVDALIVRPAASRWAKPAHLLSRTYKTLEGALGAACRLSVLSGFQACHVWELDADGFAVRPWDWSGDVLVGRVVAQVHAVNPE